MFKFLACLFGHKWGYRSIGVDTFTRKCSTCGAEEPVLACVMHGHEWRDTSRIYRRIERDFNYHSETHYKVQECVHCGITREVKC